MMQQKMVQSNNERVKEIWGNLSIALGPITSDQAQERADAMEALCVCMAQISGCGLNVHGTHHIMNAVRSGCAKGTTEAANNPAMVDLDRFDASNN